MKKPLEIVPINLGSTPKLEKSIQYKFLETPNKDTASILNFRSAKKECIAYRNILKRKFPWMTFRIKTVKKEGINFLQVQALINVKKQTEIAFLNLLLKQLPLTWEESYGSTNINQGI